MAEFNKDIGNWKEWDSIKLSKYLKKKGVPGDYAEMLITNNVDGKNAPSITESHLKEMGIDSIGDRIAIINALGTLKKAGAIENNNREIWTAKEMLFDSNCSWAFRTCCGLFPKDAKTYVLTNNHLQIKTLSPTRCFCISLSCLHPYKHTDNVDLSIISDVNGSSVPPSCIGQLCCCKRVKDIVTINAGKETKRLVLRNKKGEEAQKRIKQQVEVTQRMER